MDISIKIEGLEATLARLRDMGRQVDYAASRALNTSAYAISDRLKTDMAATFKGGATAYTLRAFSVAKADRRNLVAKVYLRTDTPEGGTQYTKALAHLFNGGPRKYKQVEGWLRARGLLTGRLTIAPGQGMPLDRFGNMRRANLAEMLGVLGSHIVNLRVNRKTGVGKAPKAIGYFVVLPGGKSKRHPGIYKRTDTGKTSVAIPMVLYVDPVKYRKFIDLEKVAREVVDKTFTPAFDAELTKALANAK